MFEVVVTGILLRGIAEIMKDTLERSMMPDTMSVEIREVEPDETIEEYVERTIEIRGNEIRNNYTRETRSTNG